MATIINLNDTTPAAPAGADNINWQAGSIPSDGTPRDVSVYVKRAKDHVGEYGTVVLDGLVANVLHGDGSLAPSGGGLSGVGITIDGGGYPITAGPKGFSAPLPFSGTIAGWSIVADQSGTVTVEVDKHASSAPPAAPAVPNTTSDKISAAAPIALASAQTASADAAAVSTWTTAVAKWDVFGFNVTASTNITRVTILVLIA